MSEEPPPFTPDPGSVGEGVWLCARLHLFQIPLLIVMGIFWIGLSQLVYVIPAAIIHSKNDEHLTVKGLWIGAGITFLLNAACFGALMGSGSMH